MEKPEEEAVVVGRILAAERRNVRAREARDLLEAGLLNEISLLRRKVTIR
jgi:hypothetical protein